MSMLGVTTTACGRALGCSAFISSSAICTSKTNRNKLTGSYSRRVNEIIKAAKHDPAKSKIAILSARKKEKIKLPNFEDNDGGELHHVSEFFNHPDGFETMLNVDALEKYEALDSHTYRCNVPAIHFLDLDIAPVLDLRIIPSNVDCTVEMLSCKLEGSDIIERQNSQFSASMRNHITWEKHGSGSFLQVDVKLNIELKIYTLPFTLLPVSAVEGPGNIVMGAVLDRFVPLLLQRLLKDYEKWINK